MKRVLVLLCVLTVGVCARAQEYPKIEVPVGFSFVNVHPNLTPITTNRP